MAITGKNRWSERSSSERGDKLRFWDYRPFTRVVVGFQNFLNLQDYIAMNRLEGAGLGREHSWFKIKGKRLGLNFNSG
jgi:hypothetical protein